MDKLKLENQIKFVKADSEILPFEHNTFDGVKGCFWREKLYRNLEKGLSEMRRVLKRW
ncbi:MAG: methyltransferase domain-containing protein [Saprospiraceae bacterium]|nr:methyltransferase domain-containing protein [Saprospiraceae bacterium]